LRLPIELEHSTWLKCSLDHNKAMLLRGADRRKADNEDHEGLKSIAAVSDSVHATPHRDKLDSNVLRDKRLPAHSSAFRQWR
jgi:hypothetical protein